MSKVTTELRGGCHCGAIRYRAQHERDSEEKLVAHACNCSMCEKVGFLHVIIPAENFKL
ncbi:hypothetical protein [Microbulbifer sp. SSSA005]|uniref:hypothetical protein n=1 Tax=Microbulbifer sp. SSSA005 TaxID=3243378 RepID=UPI0040399F82